MKIVKLILFCLLISIMMCSCSGSEVDQIPVVNTCPPTLDVKYYFSKSLSKNEADELIRRNECIAEVTDTIPINSVPTEEYSSNFLEKGSKLYLVEEGIVAISDNGESYYAALLVIKPM